MLPKAEPADKPYEAAEYDFLRRSPDGLPIEYARYARALQHLDRMPVYSSRLRQFAVKTSQRERYVSIGAWEELGPGNIGGRTRALVIHPTDDKIMFAAGVSGGVWKTTDSGASWRLLNDLLPSLAVVTLAMDPRNPDVLYAGTGEWFTGNGLRGQGIFKSTDGGVTWVHLEATRIGSFQYVNKMVVSPNDGQRVYAATFGGVFRSLDGGESWTRVLNRTSPNLGCQDIVIRADQTKDYVFTSCLGPSGSATGSAIFRNVDAGDAGAWEEVFTAQFMDRTSLALAPSNQSMVYALSASREQGDPGNGLLALYRSTQNGDKDSWEARSTNKDENELNRSLLSNTLRFFDNVCVVNGNRQFLNQGGYDQAIAVDPVNPEIVWVGGIDLFRSEDGGKNFGLASYWWAASSARTFVHADQHVLLFHPKYNGSSNQTLFAASDGGLFRTDEARAAIATGARAACSTANSRLGWQNLNNGYAVTQFYAGAVYPGGHGYFGGTQDNGTPRGFDAIGAAGWTAIIGGDGGYTAIDPANANRLYAETQRNDSRTWFRRSLNGGVTFQPAMNGITDPGNASRFLFITPFVMDPQEPGRLYLGGKLLWRTRNGAESWEKASAEFPNGLVSAIAVHPQDPNRMLVGTSTGFLHRSSQALDSSGETEWPSARPRSGVVAWISFDPSNPDIAYAVYSTFDSAGNAGHVFRTTDGGQQWERIDGTGDTSVPDIPVNSIVVQPENPAIMYAGSDIGVFVTLDSGASWAREDTGFPTTRVEALAMASNNGPVLYAFTFGRGVWRVRLADQPPCQYRVLPLARMVAFGGSAMARIESEPGCDWAAAGSAAFATAAAPGGGRGDGALQINVTTNTSTVVRSAEFVIANQRLKLDQDAPVFLSRGGSFQSATATARLPFVGVQDNRAVPVVAGNPVHSCTNSADSKPLWVRFTSDFSGTATLTATGTRYDNGLGYGLVLAAFARAETGLGKELGCSVVAAPGTGAARLTFSVERGTEYFVQASGVGAENPGGYTAITISRAP
ncbi:MAG: hypothetical protein HY235_04190 [Acidobacteria bacterium]|nr:hypothetical protein [Acidobacteriota bacterium]